MYYCRSVVGFFCYRPSIEAIVAVTFILVILNLILISNLIIGPNLKENFIELELHG